MKTVITVGSIHILTWNFIPALVAPLLVSMGTVATAHAQYRPTGDDGIAASPRVRQQLDERRARSTRV